MNNKGLTLIELITTFALASVIIVLLINIVLVIKDVYNKSNIKTELYIKQANLSNFMNDKINNGKLKEVSECTNNSDMMMCYEFSLINDETIRLEVKEKEIKFGDFKYKLQDKTKVVNPNMNNYTVSSTTNNNSLLVIKIPIICELYPSLDFGINLVYMYDFNTLQTDL